MDNMRWDEEDRLERQSIDKLLKKERAVLKAYAELVQSSYTTHFFDDAIEESIDEFIKKERAVLIQTKKALHRVIDEMITSLGQEPKEIGICKSYIRLDEEMYLTREYKGIELTYYNEWFAQGKIIVR